MTQTGENVLAELIQMGYLPESYINYRQKFLVAWDIETLESQNEDSRVEALLNIVSVRYDIRYSLYFLISGLVLPRIYRVAQLELGSENPAHPKVQLNLSDLFWIISGIWKLNSLKLYQIQSEERYQNSHMIYQWRNSQKRILENQNFWESSDSTVIYQYWVITQVILYVQILVLTYI